MRIKVAFAVLTVLMLTLGGLWLNTRHVADNWQSQAQAAQTSNRALSSKVASLSHDITQWQDYAYCLEDWGNLVADTANDMKDAWSHDSVTSALSGLSNMDTANSKLDECESLQP